MRKKDRKMCLPFASKDGSDNDDDKDLPPLSVPKFRWWQCPNCVPDIADERSTLGMLLTDRSDAAGTSSYQNVGGEKVGLLTYNVQNIDASDMVVRAVENPYTGIDEPENASSGSDDIAFCALPHKRKPKLRSLADIMEEEKNLSSEHPRMRSSSSSGMPITSTEMEVDLDPQSQLNVSVDIPKGTRSPQRKRKIAVEEDRGPLEITSSIGTAKRLKNSTPDTENTFRRVEISDSETETERLSAKTQPIKPRKHKALDINRKARQTHIDYRTATMREMPMLNTVHSENLLKYGVGAETSFGNREMGSYFKSSLSGQQTDSISDVSKSKRPEVEGDYSPFMPPSKSRLGDCNIQEKVALDLSLNSYMGAERNSGNRVSLGQHRGIPDLNESFTEKTSATEEQQLPTLPEKRSLTLHKNLDMSASSSKETTREGKRKLGFSEQQDDNRAFERGGASDDIPMEIVELLAKNQRERALDNSRKHLVPKGINNSITGSPSVYAETIPFPYTNTRSGPSGKNIGVGQGTTLNFPSSQFRFYSPLPPSQQRITHCSGPNPILPGPRPSEGSDLLWPPRRKNVPFHRPIQPNGLEDQRYKGKNVSYTKVDGKKAVSDESLVKDGKIGTSRKSVGSIDAYSNDTIPAMQLLSLMDRGIVSGTSLKVGPSSFLDKPFSPCNHHPRLNRNENQNDPFVGSSFFGQSSHTKDFPTLLNGVRYSSESSKKSYSQGQMPTQKGNSKAIHLAGPSNLAIQPPRSDPALEICTLNRNPADFSIPDARNEFTISAKDLKPRKRRSLKERSRPVNVEEGQNRLRGKRTHHEKRTQENSRSGGFVRAYEHLVVLPVFFEI
ncbi:hypothetical protein DH2020_036553 [Rehmannia glutinosa]|uniref:Uncharacterized protein n=1 Tax=Rehmannia glutinosa TaxID=99300 RepID=A0ABR0V6K9_REHGL